MPALRRALRRARYRRDAGPPQALCLGASGRDFVSEVLNGTQDQPLYRAGQGKWIANSDSHVRAVILHFVQDDRDGGVVSRGVLFPGAACIYLGSRGISD